MNSPSTANTGHLAVPPAEATSAGDGPATQLSAQEQAIVAWLVKAVAELAEIKPEAVNIRQSFTYYGLDSVQMIKLAEKLERWLRRPLSPSLAYDYPTIERVARHLAEESAG